MIAAEPRLSASERRRLAALADVILPETGAMPGASAVGVHADLADRVLRCAPSLATGLRDALARIGPVPAAGLEDLRRGEPALFRVVMLAVTAAYYLAPLVRERIGYHGQEARPIDVHELPSHLEDGSLERVIARGPLYEDVE